MPSLFNRSKPSKAALAAWSPTPKVARLARNANGQLGITVKGGGEYDALPRVSIDRGSTPRVTLGDLKGGEELLAIDGKPVAGVLHETVIAIIRSSGEEVELTYLPPAAKPDARKLSDLTEEIAEQHTHTAAIRAQIQLAQEKYRIHTVVLQRNASGSFGVTIEGSMSENGCLPAIGDLQNENVIAGADVFKGDSVLSVEGMNVMALSAADIQAMIDSRDNDVELTVLHTQTGKAPSWDALAKQETSNLDLQALKKDLHTSVLAASVPYTTRAPRPGEEDGVQYNFVSKEEFAKLDAAGKFAEKGERNGVLYGTLKPNMANHHSAAARAPRRSQLALATSQPKVITLKRIDLQQSFGFKIEGRSGLGVFVGHVEPNSVSDQAGLERGMRILKVLGQEVANDKSQVQDIVAMLKNKFEVGIEVQRVRSYHSPAATPSTRQRSMPASPSQTAAEQNDAPKATENGEVGLEKPKSKSTFVYVASAAAAATAVAGVALAYFKLQ